MPLYESVFIARQDISPSDVNKLTESFSNIISENGGEVKKTEYWGLKNLAYIIKKNKKGHYVMLAIDAPYESVKEMERRMKLNEDIIRNATFKIDSIDMTPSIMMSNKSQVEQEVEEVVEPVQVEAQGGDN